MKKIVSVLKKYRFDAAVISAALLLSLLLILILNAFKTEGAVAVIEINGIAVAEYPLSKNGEYVLNNGSNCLIIEDGAAYMTYSSCPDHTCERTGKIRYAGQTIICLPNRLCVTVNGNAEGGVDLVS